jgi:hypothetical protein
LLKKLLRKCSSGIPNQFTTLIAQPVSKQHVSKLNFTYSEATWAMLNLGVATIFNMRVKSEPTMGLEESLWAKVFGPALKAGAVAALLGVVGCTGNKYSPGYGWRYGYGNYGYPSSYDMSDYG